MKDALTALLQQTLQQLVNEGTLESIEGVSPQIDHTRDPSHGDLATNLAMVLAKRAGMPPRDLAAKLVAALPANEIIAKTEVAGPGFINFTLSQASHTQGITRILDAGSDYGRRPCDPDKKVQVEFVSANPTGPLHVGHGRGAAIGDSICRLLAATGWSVQREFYYNDAGQQIANLALSVQARAHGLTPDDTGWPEDGYQGEYIIDLANAFVAKDAVSAADREITASGNTDNLEDIRDFAVAWLRREQDADLQAFAVKFDEYFLESSLYANDAVERTVERLVASGHTYEQDDALWLRSTDFGDDKDRVMRKREGGYTYFVPDVAYHLNKWERRLQARHQRAGGRSSQYDHPCPRGPSGTRCGYPRRMARICAAPDGDSHARWRRSEAVKARRQLRHAARFDRLGGQRCHALLSCRPRCDLSVNV